MDKVEIVAAILVWLLVVGAFLMRVPGGGVRTLIAPWLALTAVTIVAELIVFNIIWFLLYFAAGDAVAWLGIGLTGVIVAATPVAWALFLRRRLHRSASGG
jgi:hypothetical protein